MIRKILELSTAHVTESDIDQLYDMDQLYDTEKFTALVDNYGAFFTVSYFDLLISPPDWTKRFSESFLKVLRYAIRNKCDFVRLDRDCRIEHDPDFDINNW